MLDRASRAIPAVMRRLLPGGLLFSRFCSVGTVRAALARLTPAGEPGPGVSKQLLADVSVIARHDAGTGIQRVVRELLKQLIANPPPGYSVRPIYTVGRWRGFRYADAFMARLKGAPASGIPDAPVRVRAGDIFLGMDLAAHTLPRRHALLARWKILGVKFFFIVYDLLPARRPDWFNPVTVRHYLNWLRTVAIFADGTACISRSVAGDLKSWLADRHGQATADSISIAWFHLGGDMSTAGNSAPRSVPNEPGKRQAILMVGTVEPRKGYEQTLAAFETLWREGRDVSLTIVGGIGWKTEHLVKRLREHAESGRRLFWFENATDESLRHMYASADGLLMASEGEGFGLPLVEAAQHAKPILVRDLPVFREVADVHAHYFSGNTPDSLAAELRTWLDLVRAGQAPSSEGIQRLRWRESAQQLLRCFAAR